MGLIQCPECGTKISSKAVVCPFCGYQSSEALVPIADCDQFFAIPTFDYDIERWEPNRDDLCAISPIDNRELYDFFGKWENIERSLPGIAVTIKEMFEKKSFLVADYDQHIADLIDQGIYRFTIDKNGEILPTIRDAKHIVKQVRLKEVEFTPNMAQSVNNLAMHAQLALILDEIEYVGDAIQSIHAELQDDRLAMAESAWDKLMQARKIQDSRLRNQALLGVIGTATDAKHILMRNYENNYKALLEKSEKNSIDMMLHSVRTKDTETKAKDSFHDLVKITNSVQVECEGYAMMGEYEAAKRCLLEFENFIEDNRLSDRNTLLLLNEGLSSEDKSKELVDEFSKIATGIKSFNETKQFSPTLQIMIEDKENAQEPEKQN